MHGFELTISPSPSWTDLTRDLVATGVTPLDLELDRFNDLLVLTERVTSDMLGLPDATTVKVAFSVVDGTLRMTFEALGASDAPAPLSDLALSVLADEHWHTATESGVSTGFTVAG